LAVPKEGTATQLSSPADGDPRFSPDGKLIGYIAAYDGNGDIYVVPTTGGMPVRVTNHGLPERIVDWYPDGTKILFASSMESGKQRFSQFYSVPAAGGLPSKLPVPYGEIASLSPDGSKIAYTPQSLASRTWKRYRGGWAPDLWMFDLGTLSSERIAASDASDEFPMWHAGRIYFLSDRGPENRANIWAYEVAAKTARQVTRFADFDIHFPALGPSDIVFEAGGKLHLLGLADEKLREVPVRVVTDEITLRPKMVNASGLIQWVSPPAGKRALFQARGDIFSVPAENGPVFNLTRTPGSAEQYPAVSPDGKSAAWWSDKTGEYELVVVDLEKPGSGRVVTSYGPGFRYRINWSPDGKRIAFVDQRWRSSFDIATGATVGWTLAGISSRASKRFRVAWARQPLDRLPGRTSTGRKRDLLYDVAAAKIGQVTSGFYATECDVRSRRKYLYFWQAEFSPLYSDLDSTWIYRAHHHRRSPVRGYPVSAPKNDGSGEGRTPDAAAPRRSQGKAAPGGRSRPQGQDPARRFREPHRDPPARAGQLRVARGRREGRLPPGPQARPTGPSLFDLEKREKEDRTTPFLKVGATGRGPRRQR
jgi:tricorn protease